MHIRLIYNFSGYRGNSGTFSPNEEEEEEGEGAFDKQSIREYFSWKNKWTVLNHVKIALLFIITFICCVCEPPLLSVCL